jgi:hypothetical protein
MDGAGSGFAGCASDAAGVTAAQAKPATTARRLGLARLGEAQVHCMTASLGHSGHLRRKLGEVKSPVPASLVSRFRSSLDLAASW